MQNAVALTGLTLEFLDRPPLRAFPSWAHWSEAFRISVAPTTNPDAARVTAFGVQLETGW
jgi:LamB porin